MLFTSQGEKMLRLATGLRLYWHCLRIRRLCLNTATACRVDLRMFEYTISNRNLWSPLCRRYRCKTWIAMACCRASAPPQLRPDQLLQIDLICFLSGYLGSRLNQVLVLEMSSCFDFGLFV